MSPGLCGSESHVAWVPSPALSPTTWKAQNVRVASLRRCCLITEVTLTVYMNDDMQAGTPTLESPIKALYSWVGQLYSSLWGVKEWLAIGGASGTKGGHTQVSTPGHLLCSPSGI